MYGNVSAARRVYCLLSSDVEAEKRGSQRKTWVVMTTHRYTQIIDFKEGTDGRAGIRSQKVLCVSDARVLLLLRGIGGQMEKGGGVCAVWPKLVVVRSYISAALHSSVAC